MNFLIIYLVCCNSWQWVPHEYSTSRILFKLLPTLLSIFRNMAITTTTPLSDTLFYITQCGKAWLFLFMCWTFITSSLSCLTLHMMAIGLLVCVVAVLRLPPPSSNHIKEILGKDLDIEDQKNPGEIMHREKKNFFIVLHNI